MRTYYGADKKRREDAKRKKTEAKRLKRLNKNTAPNAEPVKQSVASEEKVMKLEKPAEDELIN
jgi:hypothetical protein